VDELDGVIDITGVQKHIVGDDIIVYLNPVDYAAIGATPHPCEACRRPLKAKSAYCCIACKVMNSITLIYLALVFFIYH
jgi:hypothetical protein